MNRGPDERLRSVILEEDNRLAASFGDDGRWALLELVRSIDLYFYNLLSLSGEEAKGELGSERHHLIVYGLNRALSLFFEEGATGDPVPLYPSIPGSQAWADSLIQHCGRLSLCDMGLDMVRYGIATLENTGSTQFCFRLTGDAGVEADERERFKYVLSVIDEMDKSAWRDVRAQREDMIGRMRDLVYPWKERFIGYTTRPEIDEYYDRLGILWSRRMSGLDAFPGDSTFGDLPFSLYRAALVVLAGFALKHLDFCQALRSKEPKVELRNVLTIFQERRLVEDSLAVCLQVPEEAARQAVDTLVLTPSNRAMHTDTPGGHSIPLIQIGDRFLIKSISGVLAEPMGFLLAELRHRYPKDWDAAVNEREAYFRRELYQLFPEPNIVRIDCPVALRSDSGRIQTDIDAALFDQRTGSLGLFQLKWQDPFGSSLRKRESRKKNLIRSANEWVEAAFGWLSGKSDADIRQQFRLRKGASGSVYLFVLGRNFVSFSGAPASDRRAAWGMWPQFVELAAERGVVADPIRGQFEALRRDIADERAKSLGREMEPVELHIAGNDIRFEIAEAPATS